MVLYLLRKYLSEYMEGLFVEALRVWKGGFILKDLRLKADALNLLNVPIMVKVVFIGIITIQVLYPLLKYLGEAIEWLFVAALNVWKGFFVLKDLRFNAEELSSLNLPVMVKAVFIDTLTIQVPWISLGGGTYILLIDHLFVLAESAPDGYTPKDEDIKKLLESKLKQIEAPSERSWLDSLFDIIFGGVKITISNLHIRYEDSISNPGHPFCYGVTLSKLEFLASDELDNETFDASGALDKLRESLQLLRLAVDHDSESAHWKLGKSWEDLNSVDWTKNFQDGIDELDGNKTASLWAKDLRYLVFPINGALTFHPLANLKRRNSHTHFMKASLVLSDVYFTISEAQYYWCIKLLEALPTYKTRMEVFHLRPDVPVFEDTCAWWRYAMVASLQQKKLCCWFSWERIKRLCQLRRLYVQMYSAYLQRTSNVDIHAMRKIERILDSEVILLWRSLAHAKLGLVGALRKNWPPFGGFMFLHKTIDVFEIVTYLELLQLLLSHFLSWYKTMAASTPIGVS